jgi:hypothetical protein
VSAPWWTQADQAELEVLIDALLDAVSLHREKCKACGPDGPWCEALRDCLKIVVNWRNGRYLLSHAEWRRAEQKAA